MYFAHLKNIRVYTQNFLFSLISYPAQVIMFYYLWTAILSTTNLGNVTTNDLLAYYLLAFLIERLTSNRRVTDNLEEDIVTGKMAIYFVRPIPIYANNLAEYLNQLTVNSIIMAPIALLLLEIFTPSILVLTPISVVVFALMVILSGFCQFLIYFSIGILAFWLERVWGIRMGFNWITSFLSGRLIPLYLFPPFMNTFSQFLPFRFFTYELIMILLNPTKIYSTIPDLLFLCLWLFILLLLAWVLMKKGSKKFVGYGV
jgi:ABC-2 type transport system permease protein